MKNAAKLSCLLVGLFMLAPCVRAQDTASVDLRLLPSGATDKVGFYVPHILQLSTVRPAALKNAPNMLSPLYGELSFAGKKYLLALDERADRDARLYVDANGNGNLADDAPAVWKKEIRPSPDGRQLVMYQGEFKLPLSSVDGAPQVQIEAYRFDKNDPRRSQLRTALLYYSDYGYEGQIVLNHNSYQALLINLAGDGDFRSGGVGEQPGTQLLVDINANGKFDRGEAFDAAKPFNIKGTTWQLSGMTQGGSFNIVKSAQSVPEIPLPPDLSKGQNAIPFSAQTMDGKNVKFPGDYKGKLVLLDFWATWCGPCMREVPGLVKAYDQYHSKGVEILGVSLDQPNSAEKIKSVTAEQKMIWPQIYDGLYWNSRIGKLYSIDSIPHPFLVDGDTGKIVAEGDILRGDTLTNVLDAALTEKAKGTPSK
jgi:thiol-disulfide isomerase/thioredoxin